MTKKRQIESKECSLTAKASKKSAKLKPMTFDEVAAIIKIGDSKKLKDVIQSGRVSNMNMRCGASSQSLLIVACRSGFIDCAGVLLDHNADINYRTDSELLLRSACLSGNIDMLSFVIVRGVTINDSLILGLFRVVEIVRNTEIATVLVGYIQNISWQESRDIWQERNANFLYQACKAGNVAIVRLLLERGAWYFHQYHDPLYIASSSGHLEVVRLLLSWNTNDTPMSQERVNSAVGAASRGGHVEVVRCLVEYGTDVDALNWALFEAVMKFHFEITSFLLDSGADYNANVRGFDDGIFIFACMQGAVDIVFLFLERGADPNKVVDFRNFSPLKAALHHPEVMSVLLERGAEPNQTYADGSTILLHLNPYEYRKYVQAVTVLLEHGADPNLAHATNGQTLLMTVASQARGDLVKLLLEYGADVTQVNREGKGVLDMLGRSRQYDEVRKLCTQ